MASPQIEDGYTKIAHEILEALAKVYIPPDSRRCLDVIFRQTYGYNKKEDRISLSQFSTKTGMKVGNIPRALSKLRKMNIIIVRSEDDYAPNHKKRGKIYSFNKDYDVWQSSSLLSISKPPENTQFGGKIILSSEEKRIPQKSPQKNSPDFKKSEENQGLNGDDIPHEGGIRESSLLIDTIEQKKKRKEKENKEKEKKTTTAPPPAKLAPARHAGEPADGLITCENDEPIKLAETTLAEPGELSAKKLTTEKPNAEKDDAGWGADWPWMVPDREEAYRELEEYREQGFQILEKVPFTNESPPQGTRWLCWPHQKRVDLVAGLKAWRAQQPKPLYVRITNPDALKELKMPQLLWLVKHSGVSIEQIEESASEAIQWWETAPTSKKPKDGLRFFLNWLKKNKEWGKLPWIKSTDGTPLPANDYDWGDGTWLLIRWVNGKQQVDAMLRGEYEKL